MMISCPLSFLSSTCFVSEPCLRAIHKEIGDFVSVLNLPLTLILIIILGNECINKKVDEMSKHRIDYIQFITLQWES